MTYDIGLSGADCIHPRCEDGPEICVLHEQISKKHLARIELDPPAGNRSILCFHMTHAAEMNSRIRQQASARLDLQHHPARVDAAFLQRVQERTCRAVCVTFERPRGRPRWTRRIPGRGKPASDVQLQRTPRRPSFDQLRDH